MKTSDPEQWTVILIKIVATVALIVLILLTSCAPAKQAQSAPSPIANAVEMGRAIGCVFGGCAKKITQQEQREITREFDRIDQDSKKSQSIPK
jgi:hypothetical protein